MTRWRRRRAAPEPVDELLVVRLIDQAVGELGEDLTAQERSAFVNMRRALLSAAGVPREHMVLALKALGGRAAETDRSELHVRLFAGAATIDPRDASIPYDMGNHLAKLGRHDEAIAAYGQALQIEADFAWAWYNRGRLLYDSGRFDEGLDDFVSSARAGCELDGFHYNVAKRYIKERGFAALATLAGDDSLPPEQQIGFYKALSECIFQAGAYGGWLLVSPINSEGGDDVIASLILRAQLADILRESPCAHMVGSAHMGRSPEAYKADILTENHLMEALWYRPARWGAGGPEPDRVDHLEQLRLLTGWATEAGAREAAWAAYYMTGAIVLSTLLGGRRDWPTPVFRLTVPVDVRPDRVVVPRAEAVEAVDRWVLQQDPGKEGQPRQQRLAGYAAAQFRASARVLLELRTSRREPPPGKSWLVEDDGSPVMRDGEWVTGWTASTVAAELWSSAEPVFREWVTTAGAVGGDTADHVASAARARQFNVLMATELWAELPPEEWQVCRARVAAAYDTEMPVPGLRAALGDHGLLVDFYVHEIVEDTVVQLALTSADVQVTERPVDAMAGELRLLLEAHRPGEMPAEGLSGLVDELLLGHLGRQLGTAETLVLVPFGYLRNLPFHALASTRRAIDDGGISRIAYLPSTSFVDRLDGQPATPGRCLFVGFDSSGEIDVDAELGIVRDTLGEVTVLRDEGATPDTVLNALATHNLVHFACHGDVDLRFRSGYLELAGGRLSPWHLLTGRRVPRTVMLNACLTSSTGVFEPTSDEAFGLHTAFLAAGAARVVGGLWEINEWSAQHFARAFYERWVGGEPPSAAVVHAQQALRAETDDPFLWAPHAFFGDWR
jgi:CHAT domain-containing protein/tetratricopeptide (TPR) repeat protein